MPCPKDDAGHGSRDHRPLLDDAGASVVSWTAAPLGTPEAARASFASIATPDQALVAAFGFDERPIADWWTRSGRQGQAVHESLVEQPRDLGQVQADELRVKKQGGMVWMAMAMMVQTRLWLGGEVSEQRDLPLIRRLIERVRRCAAPRPLLFCTDGLSTSIRAMRETFRDPMRTGTGGRPRLRPWRNVLIAHVVKRDERRRVQRPAQPAVRATRPGAAQ